MVKPNGLAGHPEPKRKTAKTAAPIKRAPVPADGTQAASAEGETGKRILAAARKEFIAKGLEGARMQDIAAEAGVNKALLHYYYRSKDKLYETALKDILQSVWGRLRAEMRAQGPADDLENLVKLFVSTYVRTLAANPDFPLFLIREVASGGEALQPVVRDMIQEFSEIPAALARCLQAETKAGKIRAVHPVHFVLSMVGMCVSTFLVMPILRKVGPAVGLKIEFNDAFMSERIEAITSMIFHGIRKKG